jgi:hypothetical protein
MNICERVHLLLQRAAALEVDTSGSSNAADSRGQSINDDVEYSSCKATTAPGDDQL